MSEGMEDCCRPPLLFGIRPAHFRTSRSPNRRANIGARMNPACFRSIARRQMAWLLWIALLVPVAQAVAGVHGISHIGQTAGREGPGDAGLQAHCDLCLMAAAIGGGAPPAEPLALPSEALGHALPADAAVQERLAALAHLYQSRAPPFASH